MGKRYESEDQTGKKVWIQDGMEVYEQGAGVYRICFDPSRLRDDTAWVPGAFTAVDEAFSAGRIAKSVARMLTAK